MWDIADDSSGTVALATERGEFVLVLGPSEDSPHAEEDGRSVLDVYTQIAAIPSLTEEQALSATAAALGLPVHKTRNVIKKLKILVKRQSLPEP